MYGPYPPNYNGPPMGPPPPHYDMPPYSSMAVHGGIPPALPMNPHHGYPSHFYSPPGPLYPSLPPGGYYEATPPASDGYASTRCLSPLMIDTPDDRSEMGASEISDFSSPSKAPSTRMTRAKARALDACSDSGYGNLQKKIETKKIKWSTSKKALPEDPIEAQRIEKRRQRNREATAKSRNRMVKRAERGDRLANILEKVDKHFGNIGDELEKLHLQNVVEQLRLAGVDTGRLLHEIDELKRVIKEAKADIADKEVDSS